VALPLYLNQTNPKSIELIRFDLEGGLNETITISSSQVKRLQRDAEKAAHHVPSDALVLHLPVKKKGLYRLHKVIDETKLEVQGRTSEAMVVACPTARIKSSRPDRCRGDLSDLLIEVEGAPPLKVKYRKTVNGEDRDVSYQSIQPEDFVSPMARQHGVGPLVLYNEADLAYVQSYRISVPLNETLSQSGRWSYSIEKVTDALGNSVTYAIPDDNADRPRSKTSNLDSIMVHDRPMIALQGYDVQRPLRIAKNEVTSLPVRYGSTGKTNAADTKHVVRYLFTAYEKLLPNGEHNAEATIIEDVSIKNTHEKPTIYKPGLYTLLSVSTSYCEGEVLEPTSFLLVNPPEPNLSIVSEQISDKCAGSPIGLRIGLEFVGTPPFNIQYSIKRKDERHQQVNFANFDGSRGQLELKPEAAGHYTYTFNEIGDAVYKGQALKNLVLQQDVKPAVSAHFASASPKTRICIDESVSFKVQLQGEGPWTLEYEIAHGGKRSKQTIRDIQSETYTIKTAPLSNGGEYTLALASVTDKMGCKEKLQQDAKISVRLQKPKAAFGHIEGKRTVRTLEGKHVDIPLRLSGEAPWTIEYRRSDEPPDSVRTKKVSAANDFLGTRDPGKYEIIKVQDAVCPGSVDETANLFEVTWISRPQINVPESSLMKNNDGKYTRHEVCEGQEDAVDVFFTGRPPYDVKYQEHMKPEHGSKSLRNKQLNVPLQSAQIKMDTAQAGLYEYTFSELGDYNYDHDPKKHNALIIRQAVHPRPSAAFGKPGKAYSFCQGDVSSSSEDHIPVSLSGKPPFTLDVEVKNHLKASRGHTITFPNIETTTYDMRIPHDYLQPGNSALTLRRVRDANGCERTLDVASAPRVLISVHDPPSITSLEPDRMHYCVGDRITFALAGAAPFNVFYTFEGKAKKAAAQGSTFRRIAETAGNFTITGLQDAASACLGGKSAITKLIHDMPTVRVSKGRESRVDIHAGGEAEILFEFGGVPPFEFTFTRSENIDGKNGAYKGAGAVLETKTLESEGKTLRIKASEEGTYEVVAVRDRYCAFARPGAEGFKARQKFLQQ